MLKSDHNCSDVPSYVSSIPPESPDCQTSYTGHDACKTYLAQLRTPHLWAEIAGNSLISGGLSHSSRWRPGQGGCIPLGLLGHLLVCQGLPVQPGLRGCLAEEFLQRLWLILILSGRNPVSSCSPSVPPIAVSGTATGL